MQFVRCNSLAGTVDGATLVSMVITASLALADSGGAGRITEYAPFPIPASFSCEVKYDLQGNIWSDQFTGNALGEINPATGAVSEVALPNPGAEPGGMERGSDGNIYFVEVGGNAIGVLDPETRAITTYPFPWANAEIGGLPNVPGVNTGLGVPFDLTTGADGGIWFTMVGLEYRALRGLQRCGCPNVVYESLFGCSGNIRTRVRSGSTLRSAPELSSSSS